MQKAGYCNSLDLLTASANAITDTNQESLNDLASEINNEFADDLADAHLLPPIDLEAKALPLGQLKLETLYVTHHTGTVPFDHFKINPVTKLPLFNPKKDFIKKIYALTLICLDVANAHAESSPYNENLNQPPLSSTLASP